MVTFLSLCHIMSMYICILHVLIYIIHILLKCTFVPQLQHFQVCFNNTLTSLYFEYISSICYQFAFFKNLVYFYQKHMLNFTNNTCLQQTLRLALKAISLFPGQALRHFWEDTLTYTKNSRRNRMTSTRYKNAKMRKQVQTPKLMFFMSGSLSLALRTSPKMGVKDEKFATRKLPNHKKIISTLSAIQYRHNIMSSCESIWLRFML